MPTAAEIEIIDAFVEESQEILDQLLEIIEGLEEAKAKNAEEFVVFAQKIDSIMGCAKTLGLGNDGSSGLKNIGIISEACKQMGYKAWQVKDPELLNLITGFLADAIDAVDASLKSLKDPTQALEQSEVLRINERLLWLSKKIKLSPEAESAINKRFGMG